MSSLLYELNRSNVNRLNFLFFDKDNSYYDYFKDNDIIGDFNYLSRRANVGSSLFKNLNILL